MYISQTAAQSIAEEIGREFNEHTHYLDGDSEIVAGTDPDRAGSILKGGRCVLEERL